MPWTVIRFSIPDVLNNHILLTIIIYISSDHLAGFVPSGKGGLRRKGNHLRDIFKCADAGRGSRTGNAALIQPADWRSITYRSITSADSNTACPQSHGAGSAAIVLQRAKIELGTGNRGGPSKPRLSNKVARCSSRRNQVSRTVEI